MWKLALNAVLDVDGPNPELATGEVERHRREVVVVDDEAELRPNPRELASEVSRVQAEHRDALANGREARLELGMMAREICGELALAGDRRRACRDRQRGQHRLDQVGVVRARNAIAVIRRVLEEPARQAALRE